MLGDLKSYQTYKNSGLLWLGNVPEHWELRRAKALFAEARLPVRGADEIVTCFRDGQVTLRRNRRESGFMVALSEAGYQGVRQGQLVIHAMDAFAGAIGVSDSDGKCTPEYIVCAPRRAGLVPGYFAYVLRVAARSGFIQSECPAVRERAPRLRYPNFAALRLPVPSFDEQELIARYLTHLDTHIRGYIHAKQKLIKILDEQKRAIVDGVFKELETSREKVALRYVATKFGSGITPRGGATVYEEMGIPFLRSQNVHFDGLHLEGAARISLDLHASLGSTHVRPGDVLLNITGASIGRTCFVPDDFGEGNVNQHVCIIRPRRKRILPAFLAAFLSTPAIQREIRLEQNGASREGLTLHSIRSLKLALPSIPQQLEVLQLVSTETSQSALGVAKARAEIDLLRELHTRLVADVVTGKLDVRETAANLPDESEESGPLADEDLLVDASAFSEEEHEAAFEEVEA